MSKTSYELDILKVASVLGINQERLLSYVYSKTDQNQRFNDKKLLNPLNLNKEGAIPLNRTPRSILKPLYLGRPLLTTSYWQ
jgi:hypothetical protein